MMTRKSKHLILIASMIMILPLLVVACDGAATEAPEVDEPAEIAEVEEPAEIVGGFAQWEDFLTLDPAIGMSMEATIFANVYEGLTYTPEYDTQLALPLLATSWESSDDLMEWTYHLREGVKFHDGTEFTADAVKYSFERTMRMGLGGSYILDPIFHEGAIEVIDDYTVAFHLAYPAPMDVITSSAYSAWIFSPTTTAEQAGDSEDWFNLGNDTGTGPYEIDGYERGRRVILRKFEDYWVDWAPGSFDVVFFDVVEDPIVLQQMIESGESDVTFGIPLENRELLEARDDVVRVEENTFIVGYIPINTQHPPLDIKEVRQALAYSFPYDDYINIILEGFGIQAYTTVPEGAWGHCDTCFQYYTDLDKARELLAEAGFPDGGFELEIVVYAGDPDSEQYAQLWKAELDKLGIELTINVMTTEAAYAISRSSPEEAPDLVAFSWWQDIVHPLIEEAPAIFLQQVIRNWYVRSDVEGFVPNPAYTNTPFWKFLTRTE
jgi:peptide/nickel transport system substrate-binding protein